MKKLSLVLGALITMLCMPFNASAATSVLDFEGVNSTYPSTNYANVQDYFNDGTSSQGTTGADYGVSFSPNALAICLKTPEKI